MAGQNYARLRKETKFDVLELAVSLRRQVARYVMNEKRVSKKWRYFDGLPAVNYARTIRDYISYANDIRLDDPERAEERILLQEKALQYCNVLHFQLLDIIEDCEGATHENIHVITDTLSELIAKLKKWHKSDIARSGEEPD
ncbi:MAG: hypothetical protein LUD72_11395 [Bacteroidales bacterium]|nr:hypothetical protein [Bacteroidales bacterium]